MISSDVGTVKEHKVLINVVIRIAFTDVHFSVPERIAVKIVISCVVDVLFAEVKIIISVVAVFVSAYFIDK